jgi:hypothetical protein
MAKVAIIEIMLFVASIMILMLFERENAPFLYEKEELSEMFELRP